MCVGIDGLRGGEVGLNEGGRMVGEGAFCCLGIFGGVIWAVLQIVYPPRVPHDQRGSIQHTSVAARLSVCNRIPPYDTPTHTCKP